MMPVYLEGIGLRAPGLESWEASRPVLAGNRAYVPFPVSLPPCTLLPANERRRMVTTVKLALLVWTEAFANAKRDPAVTATVFSSSGGDGDTIHNIFEVLASAALDVSPTRFHNSVHNAPSGYWSIATKSHEPTTSLCAYDASFAAGLLGAATQTNVDDRAVALVAYDLPYPEPLHAQRPIHSIFGVALVMTPAPTEASFARLSIALGRAATPLTAMKDAGLEALRTGNPAARSLPLLAALAAGAEAEIALDPGSRTCMKVRVDRGPW